MTTNNAVNAPFPLSATQGGSGINAPTAHAILIGEGSSAFNEIVLSAGEVLIGTTSSDPTGATLTAGTGISITSSSGSITIAATGAEDSWVTETSTTVSMTTNTGYGANSTSLITFTLPSTSAAGDQLTVSYQNTGGWKIAQGSGQQIIYGSVTTTSGTSGYLESNTAGDYVWLRCLVANDTWIVASSVGNLTYN